MIFVINGLMGYTSRVSPRYLFALYSSIKASHLYAFLAGLSLYRDLCR